MTGALETWLETATRNLAPKAVTQISNEITAHVESAVAQHQLEGMGEEAALELAVQELGSAKVAARGYRRVHLTVAEVKALDRHDLPIALWGSISIPPLAMSIWWQLTGPTPQLEIVFFHSGVVLFNLLFLCASLCKRFERKAFFQLLAMNAMWVCSIFGSVYALKLEQKTLMSFLIFLTVLTGCYAAIRQWMTWRKLRITSSHLKP